MRQALLLMVVMTVPAGSHRTFQPKIPNGANVPDAPGVGHVRVSGGGTRNEFGTRVVRRAFRS
jgi:hypothetical protein